MGRALCPILAGALIASASANDGATNATGIAGPFVPNYQIQMVTQDLRILIHDDFTDFEVKYLFRNYGVKTTVGMAFPVEGYNFDPPVISRFESFVDGRKVPVRFQMLRRDTEDNNFEARYYKRVSFNTNGFREVIVRYRAENGIDSHGTWYVSYLLEPGSTWKGKLERCRISIDWSNLSEDRNAFAAIHPTGSDWTLTDGLDWKIEGPCSLSLEMRDYEPSGTLAIALPPGFTRIRVNGKRIPFEAFQFRANPILRGDDVFVSGYGLSYGERPEHWLEDELLRHQFCGFLNREALVLDNDRRTLRSKSGHVHTLPRESELIKFGFDSEGDLDVFEYVSLRDLVETLGGTYRYLPKQREVVITLPNRAN